MATEQVVYFTYKISTRGSEVNRIPIDSSDVEGLLQKLEGGAKLFDVISAVQGGERWRNLDRGTLCFSLDYAFFEMRTEEEIGGERLVSEKYKQMGKLLVPHHGILNRKQVAKKAFDLNCSPGDREKYERVLDCFKDTDRFYGYKPISSNKVLELSEDQLK